MTGDTSMDKNWMMIAPFVFETTEIPLGPGNIPNPLVFLRAPDITEQLKRKNHGNSEVLSETSCQADKCLSSAASTGSGAYCTLSKSVNLQGTTELYLSKFRSGVSWHLYSQIRSPQKCKFLMSIIYGIIILVIFCCTFFANSPFQQDTTF